MDTQEMIVLLIVIVSTWFAGMYTGYWFGRAKQVDECEKAHKKN